MKNSTLLVFSVLKNTEEFVKKGKDIDIYKMSNIFRFQKSSKFYVENAKRMYNDIENGYYTLKELAIYLMYHYLMGEKKIKLYSIKPKHITDIMKLFTTKRLKEDLNLLKAVHKQLKLKNLSDYFHIKEDGTNIAFGLTKIGKISPVFFIRNFEKFLTNEQKDDIINSKEYEQFVKIAKKIKDTLKGGKLHANQEEV